jgi:hypothetical protein
MLFSASAGCQEHSPFVSFLSSKLKVYNLVFDFFRYFSEPGYECRCILCFRFVFLSLSVSVVVLFIYFFLKRI